MTTQPTVESRESPLRAREIRELIREAHGASAPDHVGRVLRDRYMEPAEEDALEIATMLAELADVARKRIEEEGIEPLHDDRSRPPKLSKRERECVANLSSLLSTRAQSLAYAGRLDEALDAGLESLAWGRVSQDPTTQSCQWMTLYFVYERMGEAGLQRVAIERAVAIAAASGLPILRVEITLPLISYLIEALELDEAERLNTELQSILLNDIPEDQRHPHYAVSLAHAARIARYRGRDSEAIQCFRDALRWVDGAIYPVTRSSLLSQLGSAYSNIEQYRQCIECQREVVQLADKVGYDKIKSWAYINLAHAHKGLGEYEEALELLAGAERACSGGPLDSALAIITRRADLLVCAGRLDEAAALGREIIERTAGHPRPMRIYSAVRMLGDIDEKCSRYEEAEANYRRAVEIARQGFPQLVSPALISLARILHMLERHEEALAMLDECASTVDEHPTHAAQILRLRAAIAETRGDLRAVIDYEREAVAIEQELLERKAEQALRNARVMAQTDLLESEAELERERRSRAERELAGAVVELGDRKRQAAAVEERLRKMLTAGSNSSERAVVAALREAIASLRTGTGPGETVHHYLSKVDEDFQGRLRGRFPSITRKQERLCGLIRAGLDSKEIASLLALEPEGLKALRKRLRKALGIGQEESLETFLSEL